MVSGASPISAEVFDFLRICFGATVSALCPDCAREFSVLSEVGGRCRSPCAPSICFGGVVSVGPFLKPRSGDVLTSRLVGEGDQHCLCGSAVRTTVASLLGCSGRLQAAACSGCTACPLPRLSHLLAQRGTGQDTSMPTLLAPTSTPGAGGLRDDREQRHHSGDCPGGPRGGACGRTQPGLRGQAGRPA